MWPKIHLIIFRRMACLGPMVAKILLQSLFLLLSRSETHIFFLFPPWWLNWLNLNLVSWYYVLIINSQRHQTRTAIKNPKMWNQKLKSSSTTSTFLQTRKQRSPLRPWTPPTPDCSTSSSFSCSYRSSASRNMLRHISSHKHKACRARTRPRFSSDSLHSAISLTRRVKLQSKLL